MSIKIGTYNIQHGVDRLYYLETQKTRLDLKSIAEAIRKMDLDICGLNEVWNHPLIEGVEGECNQAKVLAERLGYPYYFFAKAIPHGKGGEYGNALLSKYPIVSARCIPLHIPVEQRAVEKGYYEDRVLLVAEISVDGTVLTVLDSHFGLNGDEIDQAIEAVGEVVSECKTPVLLMGDLNFFPNQVYYSKLCEILTDTATMMNNAQNTFTSENPQYRIDYIFVNDQVKILSNSVPEIIASDHRPYTVVAEI